MSNITVTNLPVATSVSGSAQLMAVQSGTSVSVTAQQIANLNANGGTVTSITAQSPLSGGTITTTGTIGLNTNSIDNTYLAVMGANTIKGNNSGSAAQPQDLTVAQTMTLLGAAPLNSPTFTGNPQAPTPATGDSSVSIATTAFVKAQGYGSGSVTSITAGTGLSGGTITTSGTIAIANTGVNAQTYGNASTVPQIAVNAQGQITSASNITISIPSGQVTGLGTMATQNANAVAITGGTINQTTIGGTTPAAATFTNLTATGTTNFSTISSGTWQGTPVAIFYGGTGATTASGARTNLSAAQSGANSDITSLSGLTTPLSETQGGTGYGSYTTGDILYASSSTTLARLNDVATGNALISGGVGVAPSWGKIGLTTHVNGTLPVANGGTGATTLTGYLVGNGTSAVTAVATIPNAGLTNSSITIGSTAISLGASTSTLSGLTTVTVTQDPTAALQLSTKQYVDGQVASVSNTTFHASVSYATLADLGTVTYSNGTGGVGATITNAGTQAALAIDGYTFTATDVTNATRVMVKNQSSGLQNGIYVVTNQGSGSTNWVLTRSTDFNTVGTGPNFIETGAAAFVTGGTSNGSTSWVMNTTGTITVGSTALVWVQTSSSGNITVTAPITKTGNTIGLGTVGVANGGTGLTTLTAYGLLYAASTSSVGQISPSTSGYPLLSTGASTAPAFGQLALGGAGVTGTLGVTNGGTGTATAFTTGSVVFAGASGVYSQNNAKFFWDNTNNRLGINTATPQTQLTVVSNTQTTTPTGSLPAGTDLYIVGANAANTRITQDAYGTGAYGAYTARSARGTAASPTASQSGDFLAQFTARGYGATGFATASTGYFAVTAAENFTDTAQGTYASIFTTATGGNSATEAFRFGPAGQLGIGGATYGTSGQFLTSGGASAAPSWTTVTLATLGGVVPVASGGTNITSYTVGDLLYASASTTLSKLADVATGSVLVSGGVGVAPAWSTSPTVTALTTGSVSNSGNETFTGTGARILGDFTNATITNRLAFQTSTTNGTTGIYALPNGTSTAASWQATNAADPTNASKILIATNGSTDVQLVSGINGTGTYLPLSFYTSGAQKMQLDTSGNLGIGVTPSPANLPTIENAYGLFTGQQQMNIATNAYYNGGWKYQGTGYANRYYVDRAGGAHIWYNAPSGLVGNAITFTQAMTLDASGNLGIGATSAFAWTSNTYNGTAHLTLAGSGEQNITVNTTDTNLTRAKLFVASGGQTWGLWNDGAALKPFVVGGYTSEWMRIDSSGNVGIGTTSPTSALGIARGTGVNATIELAANNNTLGTTSMIVGQDGTNQAYCWNRANSILLFGTNNTERMRIDSSGNVNIGTYGVAYKLVVYGANPDIVSFHSGANATRGYVTSDNGAVYFGSTYGVSNIPTIFTQGGVGSGGVERMRIDTSGNIIAGSGEASATPVGNPVRAPNATGTNITGGNLSLYAGNGTGTGGSGYIDFQVAPVGSTGTTANTLASAMRILANGNVGIGTPSPGFKLDVNGAIRASSDNGIYLRNSANTFIGALITPLAWGVSSGSTTDISVGAINNLTFFTGGSTTERARIDSSGNLLVGTTSSPSGSGNLVVPQVYTGTSATAANVYVDSTGKFFRSTASASGMLVKISILTSGTSFTTQATTNSIYVECVGGGGGGGNGTSGSGSGAGGGAGAYAAKYFSVSPSTAYYYAIGLGGAAATAGGNTTFTVGATTVTAGGGSGGQSNGALGGLGGTATNGDLNTNGNPGNGAASASAGGTSVLGSGGRSSVSSTAATSGNNGGGGGGASSNAITGGSGGTGLIRIWEYT